MTENTYRYFTPTGSDTFDAGWYLLDDDGMRQGNVPSEAFSGADTMIIDGNTPTSSPLTAGAENDVYLVTSEGRFLSEAEITAWDRYQLAGDFEMAVATPAPAEQREAALRAFRGEGIPLYRVLLDLHSGRLFGTLGVWIVDAAAVAMLFLTMTGVWYALRVKRR